MKNIFYPIIALLLVSCSLFTGSNSGYKRTETLSLDSSRTSPTPTYLLLTNYGSRNGKIPAVSVSGTRNIIHETENRGSNESFIPPNKRSYHPPMPVVSSKTRNIATPVEDQFGSKDVGSTTYFNVITAFSGGSPVKSSVSFKLLSKSNISTGVELYIWEDSTCAYSQNNTPIDYIKNNFIDIYADMTSSFGSHWGNLSSVSEDLSWLSNSNRDIHILLTDIERDGHIAEKQSFIAGYFAPGDTFYDAIDNPSSNKALNLVIDSYDYFHPKENDTPVSWSGANDETASLMSTIIHEFQHMIHFYQKGVKQRLYSDRFFNEMFSMAAEDLLADQYLAFTYKNNDNVVVNEKLSPDFGRIPEFNLFWDQNSSFLWEEGSLNSYSMSYALGAYLLRNYGMEFFHKYLEQNQQGISGVINALTTIDPGNRHTIDSLLTNFGTAVLKSDNTASLPPYKFNDTNNINISGNQVKPLNFFDSNYTYPFFGSESNRLFDGTSGYSPRTNIQAQLRAMTVPEINNIQSRLMFLKESNIYIYLGMLDKNSIVTVTTFNTDVKGRLVY